MWLERGRHFPNSHRFWNVAGTFQNHIVFWNVAGTWQGRSTIDYTKYMYSLFHHHVCFLMWQKRARVTFHSRPTYDTFCGNVTGVLSLNVAGMFQNHFCGNVTGMFLMWQERSQTTLNLKVAGMYQRNAPKSLVRKHDRNVPLECGRNVPKTHSIRMWQQRGRNIKKISHSM